MRESSRDPPGPEAAIASLDEARRVAEQIADLSAEIRKVPGLDEGHVERFHSALRGLIRDYGKRPWWHHRFLVRELDAVAPEVRGLAKREPLSPDHLAVFDAVLYGLKHRRFRTAGKSLRKLDGDLSLVAERERLREAYRSFRRRVAVEAEAAAERLAALESVPRPEAGPSDVEALERLVESFHSASAEALRTFLARAPGREVIRAFLHAAPAPSLSPPDPEAAKGLLRLLEAQEGGLGRMDLHGLLEASGYSEARFAHLAPGASRLRGLLASNAAWLRSLSAAEGAAHLSLREPAEVLEQRLRLLLRFMAGVPGGEKAVEHLAAIQRLAEGGSLAAILRSARIYREHGEAARKRWEGTLEREIEEARKRLEALRRDLDGLPEL